MNRNLFWFSEFLDLYESYSAAKPLVAEFQAFVEGLCVFHQTSGLTSLDPGVSLEGTGIFWVTRNSQDVNVSVMGCIHRRGTTETNLMYSLLHIDPLLMRPVDHNGQSCWPGAGSLLHSLSVLDS